MNEILLNHTELLFLLEAVGAHKMVSIAPRHLFPVLREERSILLQEGKTLLKQRGLLQRADDGELLLDSGLRGIIMTAAYPQVATLLIHNNTATGLRRFWFYQSSQYFVEHTVSGNHHHRFVVYPNLPAVIDRMEQILSIQNKSVAEAKLEMDQGAFFIVKNLAERHETEEAGIVMGQQGLSNTVAAAFLRTLEQLHSAGNIAFLRCSRERIVDGRNIALLQDEHTTWSARQLKAGQPLLTVEATNAQTVKALFRASIEELLARRSE